MHVIGAQPGRLRPIRSRNFQLPPSTPFPSVFARSCASPHRTSLVDAMGSVAGALTATSLCMFRVEASPPRRPRRPARHPSASAPPRLVATQRSPKRTADHDALYDEIILSLIELNLLTERDVRRPISLLYPPLGTLFKGRDEFLASWRERRLASSPGLGVRGKGFSGWAASGRRDGRRVRLAACRRLLGHPLPHRRFAENLDRNLAELVGPLVLNLPEQAATGEHRAKSPRPYGGCRTTPAGCFLCDNVD